MGGIKIQISCESHTLVKYTITRLDERYLPTSLTGDLGMSTFKILHPSQKYPKTEIGALQRMPANKGMYLS